MEHELWAALKILTGDDKNEYLNILMPCITEQILEPRHTTLAFLEIIFDAMQKDGIDEKEINSTRRDIEKWLMRWDIKFKEQLKKGPVPGYIPEQIDEILYKKFNKTFIELLEKYKKYIPTGEDLNNEIEERADKLTKEWIKPKFVETIVQEEVRKKREEFDPDAWKTADWKGGAYRSEKEFKNMTRTEIENLIEQGVLNKDMLEQWEQIEKQSYKSLSSSIQNDNTAFDNLFQIFDVSPSLQEDIKILWYGPDPYQTPLNINSFLGYAASKGKSLPKVRGNDIPQDISRVILQVYIIGLVQGLNLKTIYQKFLKYATEYYGGSYTVSRKHIYDPKTNVPNKSLEEKLEEVFNNIEINPNILYIRRNWDVLKKPPLDISELCKLIANEVKDSAKAWTLQMHAKTLIRKNSKISRDDFASEFYKFANNSKNRTGLKQRQIKDALKYQLDPNNPKKCKIVKKR